MSVGMQVMEYTYMGDRNTYPAYKNRPCRAIRNSKGKCIRGKNGNMLVLFADGTKAVVVARLLRKQRSIPL